MSAPNPYEAPGPDTAILSRKIGLSAMIAEVAVAGGRLGVWFSTWSGMEVYSFDGTELLRRRGFQMVGRRRVSLASGALVEVRVHLFPLWHVSISVDGRRVVDDLFPLFAKLELLVVGVWALYGILSALMR